MTDIYTKLTKELEIFHPLFVELSNHSEGYDIYLGGGVLRGLFYHLTETREITIKDLDFFLVPKKDSKELSLPMIPKSYVKFNCNTEGDMDVSKRGVKRIVGLRTIFTHHEVQLIVYGKNMTQEELAEDLDCNVNQIMYNIDTGTIWATPDFHNGFYDKTIRLLHTFSEERMLERLVRMKKRLPMFKVETDLDLTTYGKKPESRSGSGDSSISMVD